MENWPIYALIISLAYNFLQNLSTRRVNKDDKETETIVDLRVRIGKLEDKITAALTELDKAEKDIARVGAVSDKQNTTQNKVDTLTERVDNTRSMVADLKQQISKIMDLVTILVNTHSKS